MLYELHFINPKVQEIYLHIPGKLFFGHLEARPFCIVAIEPDQSVVWVAPLSSQVSKYRALATKKKDQFVFFTLGTREEVLLLQNLFPIPMSYIKRPYCLNGVPFHLRRESSQIAKKVKRLQMLYRRKVTLIPEQPNIDHLLKEAMKHS